MPDYIDDHGPLAEFEVGQRPAIASLEWSARYNAEARRLWLPAQDAVLTTATFGAMTTTGIPTIEMLDASSTFAYWTHQHPIWSAGRPLRYRIYFAQSGTAAGNFRVIVTASVWKPADLLTTGSPQVQIFSTEIIAAAATANTLQIHTVSIEVGQTIMRGSDHFASLRLNRTGGNAADTCTDTLRLLGVEVSHR